MSQASAIVPPIVLTSLTKAYRGRLGAFAEQPLVAWSCLMAFLADPRMRDVRSRVRALRLSRRTSKHWVAGYPRLLAEWDAGKNDELYPDEVSFGSQRPIWWKCPAAPDHRWRATARSRIRGAGCPFCANKRVSITNSLAKNRPDLAKEWHASRNGKLKPRDVVKTSNLRAWWKCSRGPDHEWRSAISGRTNRSSGCPFCAGLRVSVTNSLLYRFPAIALEWDPDRNGPLLPGAVTSGSSRIVWWRCARGPDHQWRVSVNNRTSQEAGCPFCAGHRPSVTNSLASVRPDIAGEWHRHRNGALLPTQVTWGSSRLAWWRCGASRAHVWRAAISNRTLANSGCPICYRQGRLTKRRHGGGQGGKFAGRASRAAILAGPLTSTDSSGCGCVSPIEHGADCYCAVSPLIHALGKRHALSVISFLGGREKVRFSEIQERFSALSSSTLATRLQELEESGLIARSAYQEQHKVEYRLTPRGRALQRSLRALFPRPR